MSESLVSNYELSLIQYFTTTTPRWVDDSYSPIQTCLDMHIQSMCEWVGGGAPDGLGVVKYPPTQPVAQKPHSKGKPTHYTTHSLPNTLHPPHLLRRCIFYNRCLLLRKDIFLKNLLDFSQKIPILKSTFYSIYFKKCQKHSQSHTQINSTEGSSYWML